MKRVFGKLNSLKWRLRVASNTIKDKATAKTMPLAVFDPSIGSDNMGDAIIYRYGRKVFRSIFDESNILRVPTHVMPEESVLKILPQYKYKIVCGTNLITPHIENYSIWHFPGDLRGCTNVITLAVGMEYYSDDVSKASCTTYKNLLSHSGIHSVRDRYTEQKFHEMGIHNVINTGCVTLWDMTPEKCAAIPKTKAHNVIATITDYSRDPENDRKLLETLLDHYESVYVWIQGKNDLEYLQSLIDIQKIKPVARDLDAFEAILNNGDVDYVGTRLHAGIFALNHGVRSIIVSIDNRAREMGADTNLPVIEREELADKLGDTIDSDFTTALNIPWDNIHKWKQQFKKVR